MIHIYVADDTNVLTEVTQFIDLGRAGAISVTENAEEASVGSCSIIFDDPTGVFDVVGLRDIVIQEDLATFQTIWRGQVAGRRIGRGDYRAGPAARVFDTDLVDLNTRLAWRLMLGTTGNRPAETDVARMTWLMTQLEITDIVSDTSTYFDTSSPVNMDATDYRQRPLNDLLNDVMQAGEKNCYLLNVDDGMGGYAIAIWYGKASLTTFSSTISISNDIDDVDGVSVFFPFIDAELARSPDRVYDKLQTNYDGGRIVQHRNDTFLQFFAVRDTTYDSVDIKSSTIAAQRGTRQLLTMSTEDDVIDPVTIQVPPEQVNDVRAGMRIQAKFTHFAFTSSGDSYDDFTWFRVLHRTVTFITPEQYTIQLALSPQEPVVAAGDVLIAFMAGADPEPTDMSTHAWTKLYWSDDFCTYPGPGAGPPVHQGMGVYVRDVVPGESATVLHFAPTGSTPQLGAWVYQVSGIVGGAAAVTLAVSGATDLVAAGASKTLSASVGSTESVIFGEIAWGKVAYDGGWCAGGLSAVPVITTAAGNQVIDASGFNDCSGATPWSWQGYATGTGTLSITAQSYAGDPGWAYPSGWAIGKAAITAPVTTFAISQQGFGKGAGLACDVTLPSAP